MPLYYQILYGGVEGGDDGYGVAYLPIGQAVGGCFHAPRIFHLPYIGVVTEWKTLTLELRDGGYPDYLASNIGSRMCSTRLKDILQSLAAPIDELHWLPIEVTLGTESRPYWILHFPNPPDVLNKERTIFAGCCVVKPVLAKEVVGNHQVFSYPRAGQLKLFVSEQVKRAIEAAGCTGGHFSRSAMR